MKSVTTLPTLHSPSPDIVKLIQLSNSCVSNPRLSSLTAVLTGGVVKLSSSLPSPSSSPSCSCSSCGPSGADPEDCSPQARDWRSPDHHADHSQVMVWREDRVLLAVSLRLDHSTTTAAALLMVSNLLCCHTATNTPTEAKSSLKTELVRISIFTSQGCLSCLVICHFYENYALKLASLKKIIQ